ncbi:MAG: peroxidase-related enzyme [Proteobacteria bacterium]|nr:peroxidase-related enzyme [Pseudomonadota bacterium]
MIVVVTSAMNDCQYCVVAHGAILRIRDRNPLIADQIAINYLKADLSERQVIMLKLALKITSSSGEVTDADLDEARTVGFDEEDLWDIGAITAFFALSNRMANFSSMRPNDEFYDMGRNSPQ